MSVKQLINELVSRGHKVKFFKRKDGSYRITRIDDTRYTGSKGNQVARDMIGAKLSERRTSQLEAIRRYNKWKEGRFGYRKRPISLPKRLSKKLKKVQEAFRKRNGTMTISRWSIKYHLDTGGEEEAMRALSEADKYAHGYAYTENVKLLLSRIEGLSLWSEQSEGWIELYERIVEKKDVFKEEWIWPLYQDVIYPAEKDGSLHGYAITEGLRIISQ